MDLISKKIGEGTHGVVYVSSYSPDIAIKVFKNIKISKQTCQSVDDGISITNKIVDLCDGNEYLIHEKIEKSMKSLRKNEKNDFIYIPQTYGFKNFDENNCSYSMERLSPIQGEQLCHLSFNQPLDYYSINKHGIFMGIETIKKELDYFITEEILMEIVKALATMLSHIHYFHMMDGFDAEFVLALNSKKEVVVAVIDFDKVSTYKLDGYPYCISRKMTEENYDHRNIKSVQGVVKLLATSIMYAPLPSMNPYYSEWRRSYIEYAKKVDKFDLAIMVVEKYEDLWS